MSYSYIGHFVDVNNHKKVVSADVSFLKNINERAYGCNLNGVSPHGTAKSEDYPDITTEACYTWVGYFYRSILNEKYSIYSKNRDNEGRDIVHGYFIDAENYNKEEFTSKLINVSYEELFKPTFWEEHPDVISLYVKKVKNVDGEWYSFDDFRNAEEKIKNKYLEALKRVNKLEELKNTKDWFEMSDTAQEKYFDELDYAKEELEEADINYWTIEKILSIFEFLQEDAAETSKNEFDEVNYKWEYDLHRKIEVFIEVC